LIDLFNYLDEHHIFEVSFCNSLESCSLVYDITEYDIVIINFTIEQGLEVLNHIQTHNPKQRIITLSEELVPSVNDEHHCKKHYNKRRLLKPIDNSELIGCAEGLVSILGDVLRRFNGVQYDIVNHQISIDNPVTIIDVTTFLKSKGIKHKINDQKIQIES